MLSAYRGGLKFYLLGGLALALAACTKSASTPGADATLPVPPVSVSFSAAPHLIYPYSPELRADYQLTDPEVLSDPLIFGSTRNDFQDERTPLILRKTVEAGIDIWKVQQLPAMQRAEWVYAGAAISRGELWAILQNAGVARPLGLYLMRSTNDGETWTLFSALKLPASTVEFVSFSIDARGAGSITVHQEDDAAALPRGLYAYQTADGGKTWTGPALTSDDLITADQSTSSVSDITRDLRHPAPATTRSTQPAPPAYSRPEHWPNSPFSRER